MKKNITFLYVLTSVILFVSCSTSKTLSEQYPLMYEEKPVTIAIMPPINKTTHVEAKDYFYTTLYKPLCEKGYYVFSPYLTMEMFQQESAYDAENFLEGDLSPFRNVLNADAVLFTVIRNWTRSTIGACIAVDIEYILKSTKSNSTLYQRQGKITLDLSVSSSSNGSFWGSLIDLAASAVSTAATDKIEAGRACNAIVLQDLPAGKYSPLYQQDMGLEAGKPVFQQTVKP